MERNMDMENLFLLMVKNMKEIGPLIRETVYFHYFMK